MIIVKSPQIIIEEGKAIIYADIEINGERERLWYKFPAKFKEYLVTESADAFVVGILFLALKLGENVHIKGKMSARLDYTLRHYLIPALCLANPRLKLVSITTEGLNYADLNLSKLGATGISCGVDSFATYFNHLQEKDPYKISFFTFLNAGSLGDLGGETARALYHSKLYHVEKFAQSENIELIPVDTNLSEILKIDFQSSHTLRNLSCILNIQKLFKNYYYASANRFEKFSLNRKDTGDYDLLNVSMLSTESINFFSSVANLTRIERTDLISNYYQTYKFLDVCTNSSKQKNYVNCTECDKCLRTALTLELLGKLRLYDNIFDMKKYFSNKNKFIGKVLATKSQNVFNEDLFYLLNKRNHINYIHRMECMSFIFRSHKKTFKKFIKRSIKMN